MPISEEKIDELDVSKLHSEANQLLNQRLTITTTAIGIVCIVLGWLLPGKSNFINNGNVGFIVNYGNNNSNVVGNVNWAIYFGTSFLLILLAVFFWLSSHIKLNLMFITSYLIVNSKSNWEKSRKEYQVKHSYKWKEIIRNPCKHSSHYLISQYLIFLLLGLIVISYPIFYALFYKLKISCCSFLVHLTVSGLYIWILCFLHKSTQDRIENKYIYEWKGLKKQKKYEYV